ncbi:MAG: insulinase family protein [Dehalococcoidales bacterium]|nr:MAG: insulinase family protein [Dehalococcoidales bacterium]
MHQLTTLDNGLRLVTTTMPHTRSVSVYFFIGIGSRYETDQQAGISHFIEHLNFKGTLKRPTAKEISAAIEGVGGFLNGGTDKELTIYWCRVAQPHFHLALDVLVDMLFNSRFDPEDIERERQVIIEEINRSKDSPGQQVNMIIDELLWPGHPLGRDIAGNKESLTGITRDTMLDYLNSKYLPENTVVAIAGNIEHQEAISTVVQATANWTNQQPHPEYSTYQEQPNPRLRIEEKATEQVHLCLALPGLALLHPKRFALDLLNVILGEGMSSRLFTEIRDKLGLAYSIHSYTDHFLDSGSMTIYAGVESKNLPVTIKAIMEQLALLKEPIPEHELAKAKELSKGRMLLRMEDSRSIASWTGGQELLTRRILTVEEVVAIIDAITAAELKELAEDILVSSQLRLAVVGPVTDEEPIEGLLKI